MSKKRKIRPWRVLLLAGIVALILLLLIVFIHHLFFSQPKAEKTSSESATSVQISESTVSESDTPEITDSSARIAQILQTAPGEVVDVEGLDAGALSECFTDTPVSEELAEQIRDRLYVDGFENLSIEDIRDIRVLYRDFEGQTRIGQLLVHRLIARDAEEIFQELYEMNYPIEVINISLDHPVDEESTQLNRTRALYTDFIDGQPAASSHSYGLSIDINPLYNPQVILDENGSVEAVIPITAQDYVDRDQENPYFIKANDPIVQIFEKHGFMWGGTWTGREDYQHFEKGYDNANRVIDLSAFE